MERVKFCDELIEQTDFSDKKKLKDTASVILNDMDQQGIHYIDETFEKIADNHVIALSQRILKQEMLKDEDNPYDVSQITPEAWQKAQDTAKSVNTDLGIQMTGIETFLLSTYFMLNA